MIIAPLGFKVKRKEKSMPQWRHEKKREKKEKKKRPTTLKKCYTH